MNFITLPRNIFYAVPPLATLFALISVDPNQIPEINNNLIESILENIVDGIADGQNLVIIQEQLYDNFISIKQENIVIFVKYALDNSSYFPKIITSTNIDIISSWVSAQEIGDNLPTLPL
jgi:hypothetical protein